MASAFRTWLQSKNARPDLSFEEKDETYFVLALLLIRLGLRDKAGHEVFTSLVANAADPDDPLASFDLGIEAEAALSFVSTFMCYFFTKPATFMEAVDRLKKWYIPGFAESQARQRDLFLSAQASFSRNTAPPSQWQVLEGFVIEETA